MAWSNVHQRKGIPERIVSSVRDRGRLGFGVERLFNGVANINSSMRAKTSEVLL